MLAAREGRPLHNGIPHHGMLVLVGSQYLILFGIWLGEVVVAISMDMEAGAVAFGITRVLTNFLLIGAIWLLCRIERGYSTQISTWLPRKASVFLPIPNAIHSHLDLQELMIASVGGRVDRALSARSTEGWYR